MTALCDPFYDGAAKSRTACHIQDIALVKQLIPEELYIEIEDVEAQESEVNLGIQLAIEGVSWGFDSRTKQSDTLVTDFTRDTEEAL